MHRARDYGRPRPHHACRGRTLHPRCRSSARRQGCDEEASCTSRERGYPNERHPFGDIDKTEREIRMIAKRLAVPEGVEPPTFGLGNRCSILLSYGTVLTLQANFS